MPPVRLLAAAIAFVTLTSAASAQLPHSFDDAPLHAVTFVDQSEGWAVGDHGIIWHTVDGGKLWERQKSGTRASLRSVQFLTPYIGYAVGRTEMPATLGHSSGIILSTTDGGLTWSEMTNGLLPGLMAVKFFDDKNGVVAGDSTPAFPCGIFTTTNGGQSWKPFDGPKGLNWTAMDFRDPSSGVLAGSGQVGIMKNGKIDETFHGSPVETHGPFLMALSHGGKGNHFAISDLGAVFDFDSTAPVVARNINTTSSNFFSSNGIRPNAIAVSGKQLWVAGCPGTVIAYSPDEGKTWSLQETNSTCSLNAIHMMSETVGWAVGELGTILHTNDGGKKWTIQRSGGQRCGVMFIHASGKDVPFDTLAMLGAKDGHLCGVVQVGRDVDPNRLNAVVRSCGGAVTESLGVDPQDNDLPRKLAMLIRQWKPDTVVMDRAGAGMECDAVRKAVMEAVKQAADANAFPEQVRDCQMPAHSVNRLFAVHATTEKSHVQFEYSKLDEKLAEDVRDFCELVTSLLGVKVPAYRFYQQVMPSGEKPFTELVNESLLPRGGTGRRKALPPKWPEEYLAANVKFAAARRKIDAIVANPEKSGSPEKAMEEIRSSLIGLPEDVAAKAAGRAASEFAHAGRWGLAREMYGYVVETFEPYPEAGEACRWLIRFHASAEVRRRIELGQVSPLPKTVFDTVDDPAVTPASHAETEPGIVKPVMRFRTGEAARAWNRFAFDLEPKLVAFGPGVAGEPATVRARTLVRERTGITMPALEPVAPERMAQAVRFTVKPKLDGKFDESAWQTATPVKWMANKDYRTEVRMGYDDRFLYVAVTATHPVGKHVPKVEKRERDADLSGHDRVEFAFDLDRDGDVSFRFAVDQRGCLAESCWGDRGWNPKWFVAFDSTETHWTAEIAIPLGEMTGTSVAGQLWGLDFTRVVPGQTQQSFAPAGERTELRFVK
jgi:photosystem II stability/assembly factor-like uncharacterized protein